MFALLCTAHYIAGFNGQTHRPTPTATALTPLSYRPHGRYLNTILEIIGYFNLFRPSAMPIGTPLKTPPSLRDTSSINRGGLKVLLFKFYLNSKRSVIWADTPACPYGNSAHALVISTVWEISQNNFKASSLCFEITATLQPTFISLQGQTHRPAPTDFTFQLSAFH